MIDERRHPAITQITSRISIFAHMRSRSRRRNLHSAPPCPNPRPSRRRILDVSLPGGPSWKFVVVFCVCRDATSRELLSTGTFVIGSDDRSPLLDNSPFTLKAKGKWLCGVTANRTLDVTGFSSQGLNKLIRSICNGHLNNKYRVNVIITLIDI